MKKLGFGFMRLPLLDQSNQESIDSAAVCRMVDLFMQRGFCYFDTAYRYHQGLSEQALRGALVQRYDRNQFVLADKMPTYMVETAADLPRIFAHQLENCGVDYFDYYLLHALNAERYANMKQCGAFEFMQQRKADGTAKRIGFSFHDTAEVLDTILTEQPALEFVQLQINYLDWADDNVQAEQCYNVARKHGKDIIVMEPVKGGALANLPQNAQQLLQAHDPAASPASWAVRYAASLPGVFMVLSGMSSLDQVDDNTAYMQHPAPFTPAEAEVLRKAAELIRSSIEVPCTACDYCVEHCPQHISIPKIFSIYNRYRHFGMPVERDNYDFLVTTSGKAQDCVACGRCEMHCPQRIDIIKALRKAATVFDKP